MTRKKLIAGNWKMNKTSAEAEHTLKEILELVDTSGTDKEILVCPPATALHACHKILEEKKTKGVFLGAQNTYFEEKGAYTGELSPKMIAEFCTHVIIAHSERRALFMETNEIAGKKLFMAINNNLSPILCVGENSEHRESQRHVQVVQNQLAQCLKNISQKYINKIIIAYEPIWAIGTGINATKEQAEDMHRNIREKIAELYNDECAKDIRIIYGGSVNEDNAGEYLVQENIDGCLVGGASLSPQSFSKIITGKIE